MHDTQMTRSEDKEYVRGRITALNESVRFFGNAGKTERELWVCRQLIDALGVSSLGTLVSVTNDPPDCLFTDARFEVKEALDEGRRRHDEYRASLNRARAASTGVELLEEMKLVRTTTGELAERAVQVAAKLKTKYEPRVVSELDLVVYVNLDGWMDRGKELSLPHTYTSPWRSVSMVENAIVAVLCATVQAPKFLRDAVGTVHQHVPID